MRDARQSRRGLIVGLAGLAAVAGSWQKWISRPKSLEFETIAGLPGWRRATLDSLSVGASATSAVFVGIGNEEEATPGPPLSPEELCDTLYRRVDGIPMAVFSDFFCPYCRDLVVWIASRADELGIAPTWHELPLLGPASLAAAKAAIAADIQNGYAIFQKRLLTTPFRPTDAFFTAVAEDAGLDPDRLLIDMNGPEVERRLNNTRRAAELLGIVGTPSLTVGQTLVMGAIEERSLAFFISESRTAACA